MYMYFRNAQAGFFILCAAAVKVRSQGPLWRLMIVSHQQCFPKQTCPNKIKCAQAALAASLLKNIIIIKCDETYVQKAFCHNVLKSPAEIFI